jgi:hypothetical protein
MPGPDQPHEGHDAHVAGILRASRPEPEPSWQDGLERRLLAMSALEGRSAPKRTPPLARLASRARTPWLVGGAAAAGLACLALLLGLAGAGPLSSEKDSAVEADDSCRYVSVRRVQRVPRLVIRSGESVIRYDRKLVQRRVKRCG